MPHVIRVAAHIYCLVRNSLCPGHVSSLSPSAKPARSRRACLGSILSIGENKACVFRRGVQLPPGGSRNANQHVFGPSRTRVLAAHWRMRHGAMASCAWKQNTSSGERERECADLALCQLHTEHVDTYMHVCLCVCEYSVSIYICTYFALATAATALFEWPIWRRSAAERIVILPLASRLKRIVTRAAPNPTAAPTSPWDT